MVAIVESKSYPEKLYRFRSCKEYFLEEIRQAAHHNRILFTQIDCFPDSFELKPVVLQASDKQWIDHLRWIFDGGTAHNYARYVDNPIIANFLIPGLNSFKDLPLELIPGLVQSLRRFSVRVFRNRRRNLSAACFIKHIGSRKMWDDYGSHSAGMAFEFSVEKPWKAISEAFGEPVAYAAQAGEVSVFPMIYIEAQPDISDLDIFRETVNDPDDGKLIADNMMVSMGAKKGLTLFERQFSFKNSAYSTEDEWRLLKHTGEETSAN